MREGRRGFFKGLWHGIDATRRFVINAVFVVLVIVVIVALLKDDKPEVAKRTALVLRPQGPIVEQLAGDEVDERYGSSFLQPQQDAAVDSWSEPYSHGASVSPVTVEADGLSDSMFAEIAFGPTTPSEPAAPPPEAPAVLARASHQLVCEDPLRMLRVQDRDAAGGRGEDPARRSNLADRRLRRDERQVAAVALAGEADLEQLADRFERSEHLQTAIDGIELLIGVANDAPLLEHALPSRAIEVVPRSADLDLFALRLDLGRDVIEPEQLQSLAAEALPLAGGDGADAAAAAARAERAAAAKACSPASLPAKMKMYRSPTCCR